MEHVLKEGGNTLSVLSDSFCHRQPKILPRLTKILPLTRPMTKFVTTTTSTNNNNINNNNRLPTLSSQFCYNSMESKI